MYWLLCRFGEYLPVWLKGKIFSYVLKSMKLKEIKLCLKSMYYCLKIVNNIGIPCTDREIEDLSFVITTYKENVGGLNKDIERAEKYLHVVGGELNE